MSKTGKSRLSRLLPKFLRSDKSSKHDGGIDSKTPFCLVHFLDDSDHQLQIKGNWKGILLQEKVCDLLNLHEKDYFGLRFIDASGQTHWLDGNKSLSSQLKGCQTPHKLYFGVKFYAADPCKLREEITRYLFFLQVKQDILQGRLPVTFDEASELCAYAVQSELGDFDPRQHTDGYVSEFCFIPNQTEELERRVTGLHRRMGGLVPLMAEYRYLDKVKWLDMYGVDLHPVLGEGNVEYFLGLTPTGIVVYKNKNKVGNYFWPRINKVTFKGKIFIVKVKDKNNEEHVYAFELPRKTACKHLWKCCVEHHAFFRLSQTQERSSRENRVLRSVSSNRHSGRSERQANSDNLSRHPSNVNRLPSRRQPRRVCSDSRINSQEHYESQYDRDTGMVTMMMRPEPVRAPRHRSLPELQGHESPRSTKSAPWETNFDYGLYTHGKESPVSERSNRMREQRSRAVTGSDSESGISQRRKYFPNRRGSDNDSDVSVTRRRRRDIDSDSASDVSSRYPASQGHNDRSKSGFPVLYPFHDKENRPNGSIPSLHSAPAGEAKQRRRRRRSKSPSKRPPDELKQHFEYDLKDTDGLSTEELKEIPFVKVETKASLFKLKYSPKLRQKVKAAKQKSLGELDQNRNQVSSKQDPVEDEVERDMSVRSQPLPRKPSEDRNSIGRSRSGVGYSRVSRRPLSNHQTHTDTNKSQPRVSFQPFPHSSKSPPKHSSSDIETRVKPRSGMKISYSQIPSELSYQPSSVRQGHVGNGGSQTDSEVFSKSSRPLYENHVRSSSRLPQNSSTVTSDLRSPHSSVLPSDLRSPNNATVASNSKSPNSSAEPSDLRSPNSKTVATSSLRSPNQSVELTQSLTHERSKPYHSDLESSQPHRATSSSSSRSRRHPHHRDTVNHTHPRSQGAYDSDASASSRHRRRDNRPQDHNDEAGHINSQYSDQYSSRAQDNVHQNESGHANSRYSGQYSTRAPDEVHHNEGGHANSRYSGHYSTRAQDDVHRNEGSRTEPEYERLHDQYGADSWSGQRGGGQSSTGHRYRDSSSHGHYLNPPSTSQDAPPSYDKCLVGDISYSSVTSPSQTYQRHHHQPPPSSSSKPSSYSSHPSQNHHSTNRYPAASYTYDQGQSSRSYGQDDGSRSGPYRYDNYRVSEDGERPGSYGQDEGRVNRYQGEGDNRSRMSFHREQHVSRSPYQGESTQQHYDYQRSSEFQHKPAYQNSSQQYRHPSPQPQHQSMQSRIQSTPPKQQGTLPRYQGTPPRYQGTPPRYQGTPSKQSASGTPPRQNVDPRYSQGLLSVHAREHSEGSSSQASVRGNFHRSRPSAVPSATDYSGHRNQGNTLTPDQARQLLRSSNYNPDLCTEL